MLMTAQDYRESLRAYRPTVYVDGRRVDAVADEPAFAPGVRAVGLNFPDILMAQGLYQEKPPLPYTPCFELCGEIVETGQRVIGEIGAEEDQRLGVQPAVLSRRAYGRPRAGLRGEPWDRAGGPGDRRRRRRLVVGSR